MTSNITNGRLEVGTSAPASREVRVVERRVEARDVVSLRLRPTDGGLLPDWTPGSHIAVLLPDGSVRQYSLADWPGRRDTYRIVVLREPDGRGGSRHLAEETSEGDLLRIRSAENHFRLDGASDYLFIAGGIGITALLPMLLEAARRDVPWNLIYFGSTRTDMALLDELASFGDRVRIVPRDEQPDLRASHILAAAPESAHVYVCGPERMVESIRADLGAEASRRRLHVELFQAPEDDLDTSADGAFELRLAQSDRVFRVTGSQTILEVVRDAGIDVLTDCEEGICGSCETRILDGQAEHRDHVLTEQEKDEQRCLMVCVSRSAGAVLTLAL
ncbi:MAG: putative oxidoreductase [Frondihabitans sp.]|nr:putative oxidoreductase [Frondihabitans sp.]